MKSRRAKILIPLAVELAFALVAFIAIRATHGARYGLGAKAVLEELLDTYQNAAAYEALVMDVPGRYEKALQGGLPYVGDVFWGMQFFFRSPDRYAAIQYEGESFRTQIGDSGTILRIDGMLSHYAVDALHPLERRPVCVAYGLLRDKKGEVYRDRHAAASDHRGSAPLGELAGFRLLSRVTYVDLVRKTAPDGERCDVLVIWRDRVCGELWIDPATHGLRAVVFRRGVGSHTELYMRTRFDSPIDPALFECGEEGLERLRQWIAEREKAPTK